MNWIIWYYVETSINNGDYQKEKQPIICLKRTEITSSDLFESNYFCITSYQCD